MLIGLGTIINVASILVGGLVGLGLANRLSDSTRETVTMMLGLFTIVLGMGSAFQMNSPELKAAVGAGASIVVLLSLLIGAVIGSQTRLEARINALAGWLRDRVARGQGDRQRFVNGFVTTTLLYCVGPLSILGALQDGLGRGIDELLVKSVLDGFTAIAFASSLGVGVMASAISVAVYQGLLTVVGFALGDVLPTAQIDSLTAVGGVILIAMGLRLTDIRSIRVGDLLPAMVIAPLLVWGATAVL